MKFLLDANFLMLVGKFRVDVFSELEKFGKPNLYTLDLVVEELERIAKGSGRDSKHARLGLELIKKKGIKILKHGGVNSQGQFVTEVHVDKIIEKTALENYFVVCTVDRKLIKKLRNKKIPVVCLRQKKYLVKI